MPARAAFVRLGVITDGAPAAPKRVWPFLKKGGGKMEQGDFRSGSMRRDAPQERLPQAERVVALAERIVDRQIEIIAELTIGNHPLHLSHQLSEEFNRTLATCTEMRDALAEANAAARPVVALSI